MKDVISKARCYECGGTMEGRKGEYKYVECGLTSVILKDILVYHCTKCNQIVPEIPAAGILHRVIAIRLILKKNLLTGSEIRYLRKLCGYSVNDFTQILGSSKSVVSRWEKDGSGKETDRTIRLLVMSKLTREIVGQPEPILQNVTIERLIGDLEEAFKFIQGKEREPGRYEIPPEEIARYAGVPQEALELSVVQ